jgi:hypothetical protein
MPTTFSNPFKAEGIWLKGNLHTHTTVSDGIRTPQEVVDHYAQNRYDFLAITDHGLRVDPTTLNSQGMTLIPSQEISIGNSVARTTTHIVCVDIKETLPLTDFDSNIDPQRAIDITAKQGGFTIIAHPYWSGLQHSDLLKLDGYLGVEIYNTTCDVYRGTGYSGPHIDALLVSGRRPLIFATDDHHGEPEPLKPSDTCGGWIMVKAKDRSLSSIVEAIKKGHFYASNGPSIKNIEIIPEGIQVETSPAKHITFSSQPSLGARFTPKDKSITEYTYPGRKGEKYIRIEVTDHQGKTAWSNPIYF